VELESLHPEILDQAASLPYPLGAAVLSGGNIDRKLFASVLARYES